MISPLLLSAIINGLAGGPTSGFQSFYNQLCESDKMILSENNIDTFDELQNYILLNYDTENYQHGNLIESSDIFDYLNSEYPQYTWQPYLYDVLSLEKVSGASPLNIGGSVFTNVEVESAVYELYGNYDYGGCGPRAAMGIFDYLARTVHYYEFEPNPESSSDRINLAELVFQNSNVHHDYQTGEIGMTNISYTNCINGVINSKQLGNVISTSRYTTIFGGQKDFYCNLITESIKNGMPLTLANYNPNNSGGFRNHFSNIVGIRTYYGINEQTGDIFEKKIVEGLINPASVEYPGYYDDSHYFFDSEFLNSGAMCLFTYSINYEETYTMNASTFSSFVNNNGQGQYFYYEKYGTIYQDSYYSINHKRLRCSYILNQYLVLSPKRIDAGLSYLMLRPNTIWSHHLDFSAALWSDFEDEAYEDFYIEYLNNSGQWVQLLEYNLNQFSQNKDALKNYHVLLPRDSRAVRFVATHDFPEGTYNRGRIVLDNIVIKGRG